MANRLKMAEQDAILVLARRGWSYRRIARELGVHRDTVSLHVRRAAEAATGPSPPAGSNPAILITGSVTEADVPGADVPDSKPAISITGSTGRRSCCEPLRAVILTKLEQGLTARRIWQDLTAEHGFGDSYQSVQRFVRSLRATTPLPFRRMECQPGEEAQIDFGHGAPIRNLLKRQDPPEQDRFEFIAEHPLIRSLSDYGKLVHSAFEEVHP